MVRNTTSVAGFISRDRIVIAGCVVLVTALAWTYLIHLGQQMTAMSGAASMMERMSMPMTAEWSGRDFAYVFLMWSVMMVGMMTPAALPVLVLFAQMKASRGNTAPSHAALLFGATHITVWVLFSVLAASLQWLLHQGSLLSSGMILTSPIAGGLILIGAGVYQLTTLKSGCLRRCQSPLGFLLTNWREGTKGVIELALRHGIYCLGCCWALMLVLFAVGVMNLAWVAAITVFILVEKFGPAGSQISKAGGVAMILIGAFSVVR
jgi:predicted metal-binding membrane protein